MNYRFHVQRVGPVQLVLGGIVAAGLVLAVVLFASAVAIVGLIVGLVATAAGLLTYAVRRFLRPAGGNSQERRAEGIVVIERAGDAGVRCVEVEVVDEGDDLASPR